MLLLTTRGGARYRKLPEGTITPLRQAQQTAVPMPLVLARRWTLRNEFFISARPSGSREHLRSTDIHLVCQSRTHLLVCVRDACRCVCLRASWRHGDGWLWESVVGECLGH